MSAAPGGHAVCCLKKDSVVDMSLDMNALELELILVSCGRLLLLSVRPAVSYPAAVHHRLLASIKLYCLVTQAHVCVVT